MATRIIIRIPEITTLFTTQVLPKIIAHCMIPYTSNKENAAPSAAKWIDSACLNDKAEEMPTDRAEYHHTCRDIEPKPAAHIRLRSW